MVGVVQSCATNNVEENFKNNKAAVEECANKGAELVCLPENFAFLGQSFQESTQMAEPLDGPLMKRYTQLALDNRVWISFGGFQEQYDKDKSKRFSNTAHLPRIDTHIIANDEGKIVAIYRKMHLFDVDLEARVTSSHDHFPGWPESERIAAHYCWV